MNVRHPSNMFLRQIGNPISGKWKREARMMSWRRPRVVGFKKGGSSIHNADATPETVVD